MPKVVDHEARRQDIADALWRIVEQGGMPNISIRSVANEAGVPRATAAYYFRNHAELLTFAMAESVSRSTRRIRRMDLDHGDLEVFVQAFAEVVPTTARRRRQSAIWLALIAESTRSEAALASLNEWNEAVRAGVAELLTMLNDRGLASIPDVQAESVIAHALIDGLALHTVSDPKALDPKTIVRAIRTYLSGLCND